MEKGFGAGASVVLAGAEAGGGVIGADEGGEEGEGGAEEGGRRRGVIGGSYSFHGSGGITLPAVDWVWLLRRRCHRHGIGSEAGPFPWGIRAEEGGDGNSARRNAAGGGPGLAGWLADSARLGLGLRMYYGRATPSDGAPATVPKAMAVGVNWALNQGKALLSDWLGLRVT